MLERPKIEESKEKEEPMMAGALSTKRERCKMRIGNYVGARPYSKTMDMSRFSEETICV